MKILIILFASFFGFGLAVNETVRVNETAPATSKHTVVTAEEMEAPVMEVMLDTVEVTASRQATAWVN
ncbi:hypothetical protein ACXYMU_15670 [Pontibacter sp. CAU 1760]